MAKGKGGRINEMAKPKQEDQWFKFYYLRWMLSERVQALSMSNQGCYLNLMVRQYASADGDLPADPKALKRMIGADDKEWKQFEPLLDEFFPEYEGRRCNPTMAEVREEADARREMRREFASLGGVAKAKAKGTPKATPNGIAKGVAPGVLEEKRREENNLVSNSNNARTGSSTGPQGLENETLNASGERKRKIDPRTGTSFTPEELEMIQR